MSRGESGGEARLASSFLAARGLRASSLGGRKAQPPSEWYPVPISRITVNSTDKRLLPVYPYFEVKRDVSIRTKGMLERFFGCVETNFAFALALLHYFQ